GAGRAGAGLRRRLGAATGVGSGATAGTESRTTGSGATTGTESKTTGSGAGAGATAGTGATIATAPTGNLLFRDSFEVVDGNAKLRDAKLVANGKTVAKGTKVFVVKAERTYVQIVTAAGAEPQIAEADQIWTAFSNLGGTGANVGLGNEATDADDKTKADTLRAGLPAGRNAGQSSFKWQFSNYFQPSLEGKALQSTLMAKVQRLMQWAIENDMVTGDIIIGDGVRGPKTAHKMCVSWNIQYRWGTIITLDALKKLPGGKDEDGTTWYQEGWGETEAKANAYAIRSSNKIAAAGYEYNDEKRLPLPLSSKPGVSRHCTGRAVDVTIPWRKPGKDASTGDTDVWAWEDIYKQFGLHRPLHKTLVSDANLQENWHIEETGKELDGDDGTDG
ncbi:MAG TPA: D-alanyl-D-alanine carboxypeptidase family protein, partial [Kofleriaceae bacterium]|nr:D-alanyl-D-alanine carboxypeptidase family protein [Kofleriaceae bacterium]